MPATLRTKKAATPATAAKPSRARRGPKPLAVTIDKGPAPDPVVRPTAADVPASLRSLLTDSGHGPALAEPDEFSHEVELRSRIDLEGDPAYYAVEARVIYLGLDKDATVYLRGSQVLAASEATGKDVYVHSDEGASNYDFQKVDNRNKPKLERLTADGRPWTICRDVYHLLYFMKARKDGHPLFKVMANPATAEKIARFARVQEEHARREVNVGPAVLRDMDRAG
jgi:hypothetical protein